MARIVASADVEGAVIRVDGRLVGTSPLDGPVFLLPGDHEIEALRDGYVTARASTSVAAGEIRSIRLRLERPAPPERPTPAESGDRGISSTWFRVTAGVAGAAAIATGVLGTLALMGDSDYSADAGRTASDQRAGERLVLLTDVCLGIAVVGAAAAVLLGMSTDFDPADDRESR